MTGMTFGLVCQVEHNNGEVSPGNWNHSRESPLHWRQHRWWHALDVEIARLDEEGVWVIEEDHCRMIAPWPGHGNAKTRCRTAQQEIQAKTWRDMRRQRSC